MPESRRLFGTDGIRGRANVAPMTPETALRVGLAVAHHFGRHGKVIVGKDTRRSSYMFEMAVTAGLCAMGADVFLVGPLPTPGIAHVTHSMRADAGVVISASHNPFADNGIKLFAEDGFKLPDETERRLERLMLSDELDLGRADGADVGRARRIEDARGRYIAHVKLAFPDELDLEGLKVVVDCANGAGYFVGPLVFAELGADVTPLGVAPNGTNINDGCGALAPSAMQAKVQEVGADLGVALDGDGDRAIFCDEKGRLVDGDAILALCARDLLTRGELPSRTVVGTVMSNMGLERSLEEVGISLVRTPVGDRYVVDAMRRGGHVLGGEQSGHLVFLRHSTTGDGLVAALHVLAVMRRMGRPLSELVAPFEPFPQRTVSLRVRSKPPIEQLATLQRAVADLEREFMGQGRVLVRYSGTEPKIRLMVEARDPALLPEALAKLEAAVAADLELDEGA